MEWAAVHAAAGGSAYHDGRGSVPQIVALGDEIGELIETAGDEIDKLHFGDGPQAEITHAAGGSDDGAFADGRIDDAFPAETLEQTFAGLESAAINADILAEQHHRGVALHLLVHGLLDGFEKGDRLAVAARSRIRGAVCRRAVCRRFFRFGHVLSPRLSGGNLSRSFPGA